MRRSSGAGLRLNRQMRLWNKTMLGFQQKRRVNRNRNTSRTGKIRGIALALVIPGGCVLRPPGLGQWRQAFFEPRPPCVRAASPHYRKLGAGYAALPQMAGRRIGCACIWPPLATGPAAPPPLRQYARAYASRGLPASCFALPWQAAVVGRNSLPQRSGAITSS